MAWGDGEMSSVASGDGRLYACRLHFGFRSNRPRSAQLLPLQNDVGPQDRERQARPYDRLIGVGSEIFPSRYAADDPHLQEDQRQGKAARHPGAMLLNLALAHEDEGDAGGEHQQKGVYSSGNAERAGPAHALFEVLDVGSQRRRDQRTEHIHPADNAMQLEVTLSQTLGKLHRSEQNRAGAGKSMWQQPPAKWMVVLPR